MPNQPNRIQRVPADDQPTQPFLPPELPEAEATRLQSPLDQTRDMPTVNLQSGSPRPGRKAKEPNPPTRLSGRSPTHRDHPLRLPVWSVLIMLALVGGAVSCIVLAMLSLGGRQVPPAPPRFVILTAEASNTPDVTMPSLVTTPTLPPAFNNMAPDVFVLTGPTLPPVIISPTPESIAVGKKVVVTAEDNGLNVRSRPGVFGSEVLFVAPAGRQFEVVDGPVQADGFTWWQLRNPTNAQESGWAAAVFLQILSEATPAS